ncbi:MAG: hypothetical protein GC206_12985 [Alphaproteobacteria bacterium]|nr:hypothetical protein [Alphaproteobacteria bacterium]
MRLRLPPAFRRFAKDEQALAALEFALIAPMMLFLLFGAVELTNGLDTTRKVENVSASIADVVSRDNAVTDEDLDDLWAAIDPLMWPEPSIGLRARITSVSIEDEDNANVVWSEGHNGLTPRTEGAEIDLPDAMMVPGSSVILAEVEYPYEPVLGFVFGPNGLNQMLNPNARTHGAFTISKETIRRSRLVDPVPRI